MRPMTNDEERWLNALSANPGDATAIDGLAASSRENDSTRKMLGNSIALATLIRVITVSLEPLQPDTLNPALRCVGNACIDNVDAREQLTSAQNFGWAARCLEVDDWELRALTIKVLYNACHDCEAAQQQCYRDGIPYGVVRHCVFAPQSYRDEVESPEFGPALELLFWICGHKTTIEPELSAPLPGDVLTGLLNLASVQGLTFDIESVCFIAETVLLFVRDSNVQKQVIELELFEQLLRLLHVITTKKQDFVDEEDLEDQELLKALEVNLLWVISDISANPDFIATYPISNAVMQSCLTTLKSRDRQPLSLLVATCQTVGNVVYKMDNDAIGLLVTRDELPSFVFAQITAHGSGPFCDELTHAAAGLLVNLTRSGVEVRELMAKDQGCTPALIRLCRHSNSTIQQDGIKLLRSLMRDSTANTDSLQGLRADFEKEAISRTSGGINGANGVNGTAAAIAVTSTEAEPSGAEPA